MDMLAPTLAVDVLERTRSSGFAVGVSLFWHELRLSGIFHLGNFAAVCIGHEISCVCDVRLVRWCRLSQNRSPAIPKTGDLCQNAHQCAQGDGEARQVAPMEPMLRGGRTVNVARCTGDIE